MAAETGPRHLVTTDWLAAHLDDPVLRIYDCAMRLVPDPQLTYRVEDMRREWGQGHIPGSGYIDIAGDLSDHSSRLRFMCPPLGQVVSAFEWLGVSDSSRVVLYSGTVDVQWATRVWWMLRAIGFDNAAVLDGGLKKWQAEGRPVSTEPCRYMRGYLTARPRPQLMCGRDDVLAAIGDPGTVIINALSREQHAGTGGTAFGRAGRIAGSVNVPTRELVDPKTGAFKPLDEIRRMFADAGASPEREALTYCGGGIAASTTALMLTLLGHDHVRLYDASMQEWAKDETLPMEAG
jgi:thiosulfate/3-mercaptopyruvate sulfurtransferase